MEQVVAGADAVVVAASACETEAIVAAIAVVVIVMLYYHFILEVELQFRKAFAPFYNFNEVCGFLPEFAVL